MSGGDNLVNSSRLVHFRRSVLRVFNNWTSLKLAFDLGGGGNASLEVIREFIDYICEITGSKNVETDTIKEELNSFLDEYFDTKLEDGSSDEIAEILIKFWNLTNGVDLTRFDEEFNLLKNKQSDWIHLNGCTEGGVVTNTSAHTESFDNSAMDVDDSGSNTDISSSDSGDNEDSEWTLVTRRKRN